ncbi:MAG TPA: hypothetical protein PKJ77_02670 [Thermodesulfobacteriota bacterium]|nr:hypothetical protein [Thermodesulfobacteriota bacterium]
MKCLDFRLQQTALQLVIHQPKRVGFRRFRGNPGHTFGSFAAEPRWTRRATYPGLVFF